MHSGFFQKESKSYVIFTACVAIYRIYIWYNPQNPFLTYNNNKILYCDFYTINSVKIQLYTQFCNVFCASSVVKPFACAFVIFAHTT